MTDAYSWSSDSRPRPEVRITVRRGDDRELDYSRDDPQPEEVASALDTFERLAGALLFNGGAA